MSSTKALFVISSC